MVISFSPLIDLDLNWLALDYKPTYIRSLENGHNRFVSTLSLSLSLNLSHWLCASTRGNKYSFSSWYLILRQLIAETWWRQRKNCVPLKSRRQKMATFCWKSCVCMAFTSNRTACNHNLLTVSIGAGRRKSCSHALRFGLWPDLRFNKISKRFLRE